MTEERRRRADLSTNPFWPQYTADQLARIKRGRERQLERWNASPFKPTSLPSFRVVHRDQELTEGGFAVDVFHAKNAPAVFPREWKTEVGRHSFVVEHTVQGFFVLVPHSHYLSRWLPMSVDSICALNTLISLIFIAVLVRLAYMLAAS